MNIGLLIAGGISAFALVTHVMMGRTRPLPPLPVASSTEEPAPWLTLDAWFGRHAVTLVLAAMALGFSHAARDETARDLALTLCALALGLAALRLAFALRVRAPRSDIGEWGLMAAAGAAGLIGLFLSP